MEPILIFKSLSAAKAIAQFIGIADSVSTDVKKLLHQSFKSGIENLRYAQNATGMVQQQYIQRALGDFIKAFETEQNENLITAYLGASMCQYYLGDIQNAQNTLSRISSVTLTNVETLRAAVADAALPSTESFISIPYNPLFNTIKRFFGVKGMLEEFRIRRFEEYKAKALSTKI